MIILCVIIFRCCLEIVLSKIIYIIDCCKINCFFFVFYLIIVDVLNYIDEVMDKLNYLFFILKKIFFV